MVAELCNETRSGGNADVDFRSQIGPRASISGARPWRANAHARSAPMKYWTPGWLGFGGNLYVGQDANTDGNLAGFGGGDAGRFSPTRFNFANGWFVGNQRSAWV